MATETFQFQTEVQQLLELIIHSLYSHKDIFLRELVSNASDATDRLRFEALTKPELLSSDADAAKLEIRLEVDKDARTLTVHDNGIGMSKKELVDNIGTIAKSGTRELTEKINKAQKNHIKPKYPFSPTNTNYLPKAKNNKSRLKKKKIKKQAI